VKLCVTPLLAPVLLTLGASLLIGREATPQKKEASVWSGINEKYLDPELIVDDRLTFIEEVKVEDLKENYFLRFRKDS
tara:strand:- start:268 stop:501 length:234 start_codon:yes stop_codon:yes gene_type:complete